MAPCAWRLRGVQGRYRGYGDRLHTGGLLPVHSIQTMSDHVSLGILFGGGLGLLILVMEAKILDRLGRLEKLLSAKSQDRSTEGDMGSDN